MKKEPIFIAVAILLMIAPFLHADEIYLSDGKVLQGKITKEDANEYTLMMRSNIVFRIDKSKVEKVVRTKPEKPERPTVRLNSMTTKSVKSSTVPATGVGTISTTATVAASAHAAPLPPTAAQPKVGVQFQSYKKDTVTIEKTSVVKTYSIEGSTLPEIEHHIFDRQTGKGFLVGRERRATRTTSVFSWDGAADKEGVQMKWKWAVVRATVTATLPAWKAPSSPAPSVTASWNNFLEKAGAYASGVTDIDNSALDSFGQALAALRAPTETALRQQSQALFENMEDEIRKKEQGYDRRMKNYFDVGEK